MSPPLLSLFCRTITHEPVPSITKEKPEPIRVKMKENR